LINLSIFCCSKCSMSAISWFFCRICSQIFLVIWNVDSFFYIYYSIIILYLAILFFQFLLDFLFSYVVLLYFFYYLIFSKHCYFSFCVTNFIQLVSLQPVDQFSQTKLCCKAPNEGYLHILGCTKAITNNRDIRPSVTVKALFANIS